MAKTQSSTNSILVGKIVSWTNLPETEDSPERFAGHGEIIEVSQLCVLARRLPSRDYDDDEPSYMLAFLLTDPTLHFFDDEAAYCRWRDWLERPADGDATKQPNARSSARRH